MRGPGVVFQLFLASSRLQKKRAVLTIASIAWGSVSLLLLLAFGQGLREQLTVANRGMGTGIAVLWASETTKPWQGRRMPQLLDSESGKILNWKGTSAAVSPPARRCRLLGGRSRTGFAGVGACHRRRGL